MKLSIQIISILLFSALLTSGCSKSVKKEKCTYNGKELPCNDPVFKKTAATPTPSPTAVPKEEPPKPVIEKTEKDYKKICTDAVKDFGFGTEVASVCESANKLTFSCLDLSDRASLDDETILNVCTNATDKTNACMIMSIGQAPDIAAGQIKYSCLRN